MNSYQKKLTSLKRPATLVYRKWVSFMDLLKARRLLDTGKSIFDIELRVVYYARVSTDRDEQLNSLENQTGYYENLIKTNKNWTFSGGYIDEHVIIGTSGENLVKSRGLALVPFSFLLRDKPKSFKSLKIINERL